jgi:hypothetical protein
MPGAEHHHQMVTVALAPHSYLECNFVIFLNLLQTLTHTNISEKSVERLLKLQRLRSLDIRGSKIDSDRIEAQMALRPTCKVVYS